MQLILISWRTKKQLILISWRTKMQLILISGRTKMQLILQSGRTKKKSWGCTGIGSHLSQHVNSRKISVCRMKGICGHKKYKYSLETNDNLVNLDECRNPFISGRLTNDRKRKVNQTQGRIKGGRLGASPPPAFL